MPYAPQISIGFLAVSHYIAAAVLVGVVAALLTGFYRVFGRAYLRYWALSWWAFAVTEAASAASIGLSRLSADHPSRLGLSALSMVASALQVAWLLIGTWEVTRGRRVERRTEGILIAVAVAFGLLQGLAFSWDPAQGALRLFLRVGGRQVLVFAAALVAAAWLARAPAAKRTQGRRGLPYAFVGWGTFQVAVLGIIAAGRSGEPLVFAVLTLSDLAVHGLLAVATVAWLLGEERARESERAALEAAVRHGETLAALGDARRGRRPRGAKPPLRHHVHPGRARRARGGPGGSSPPRGDAADGGRAPRHPDAGPPRLRAAHHGRGRAGPPGGRGGGSRARDRRHRREAPGPRRVCASRAGCPRSSWTAAAWSRCSRT